MAEIFKPPLPILALSGEEPDWFKKLWPNTILAWQNIVQLDNTVPRLAYASVANSTAIANTAAETYFDKNVTITANTVSAGDVVRVRAAGKYSDTASPTLKFFIRVAGGTNYLFNPLQNFVMGGSVSNLAWVVEGDGVFRSVGSGGTLQAGYGYGWADDNSTNRKPIMSSASASAAYSVDTTAGMLVEAGIQWGTANASNTATLTMMTVELLPSLATS